MDYTRNEDKLCRDTLPGARYNLIYNIEDITDYDIPVVEPVTLEEVKKYLRLEGAFPDEFDFDDDLINDLITEGRVWVERYTGVHLISKVLQVTLINQAGMVELPGPVTDTIVIKDKEGIVIADTTYKFIGTLFPLLETQFDNRITLEYNAGYQAYLVCPAGLKNAIKAFIADHYEHRGDEQPDKALSERAARKARPYRRLSLFA